MKKKIHWAIFIIGIIFIALLFLNYEEILQKRWTIELNEAIDEGDKERMKVLLSKENMDINQKNGSLLAWIIGGNECAYQTPFEAALYSNDLDVINMILDYGANPYVEEQHPVGWILSSVTDGTWEERHECVQRIIDCKYDIDYLDSEGGTTLTGIAGEFAIDENSGQYSEERANAIKDLYIIAKEKCVKEKSQDGTTVLHEAVAYGRNLNLMKYLVEECGYSINVKNSEGESPLIYLFKYYNKEYDSDCNLHAIVDFCIEHKMDFSETDNSGKTAYDYAMENGCNEVAEKML